jgi:paraquat-inducible protein B
MADVFVDIFTAALIQIQPLMSAEPSLGLFFFTADGADDARGQVLRPAAHMGCDKLRRFDMPDHDPPIPSVPDSRAVPRKQTRLSLVWIIPVLAAALGVWVAVTRIMGEGPKITIVFQSAEGLEAGKTKINYRGVDVGTITAIRLSKDHQRVIATAQMAPRTEDFLAEDTRFWVVRPRISGASVTGLGTLISGAYIGMEIGSSKEPKRNFVALEAPPVVTGNASGRFFVLKTSDLGSLDLGTPLFFRRLQVGQVASYKLDKDGKFFTLQVFVKAPYDQYVTANTRFWQASGIDVSLSANGLSVQTQSLLSILIGGVAFESPATDAVLPAATANTVFTLYGDRARAFEPAARSPQTYKLIFKESVRGLRPGAPVEFRGIPVGEVADIRAQIDLKTFEFSVPVTIRLDPTETRGQGHRGGVRRGSRENAQEADRRHGGPRGPCAAADWKPADRVRVRGARLFPWRAPSDGGLVADASAAADHSGSAPGDRGERREHNQEARQDAFPGNRRRPA